MSTDEEDRDVNKNSEEKDAYIYFRGARFERSEHPHDWYVITNDTKSGGVLEPIFPPEPNYPELSSCVAVGSLIYLLGGVDMRPFRRHGPGSRSPIGCNKVYYIDTHHPESGWIECPSMLQERAEFYAACVGNKIYAIGGDFDLGPADDPPFAEVFDLLSTGESSWQPLPHVTTIHPFITGHAVLDDGRRILVHPPLSRSLSSYDVEAGDWHLYDSNFAMFRCTTTFVDGVMYGCDHMKPGIVFAYDVAAAAAASESPHNLKLKVKPVLGLEDDLPEIPIRGVVPLGNGRLCVISYVIWGFGERKIRVFCHKFRVSRVTNELGETNFVADSLSASNYYLPSTCMFVNCVSVFPAKEREKLEDDNSGEDDSTIKKKSSSDTKMEKNRKKKQKKKKKKN